MTGKIGKSLHITWEELACNDANNTPYPSAFILDGGIIELVVLFERIRAIWDKSITINSAYRTPSYNKKIGGSPRSQHMLGRALDLRPPEDVYIETFYNQIKARANVLGIKGLGKYPTFVHVDVRDSKELILW